MLQRKNKKGFTLAELLIVVAILAVLTAIAVPLFVGAIDDARSATKDANIRAVRGAAAVAILEAKMPTTPAGASAKDDNGVYISKSDEAEKPTYSWVFPDKWKVVATLTTNGEVESITLDPDVEQADVVYDESGTPGKIVVTLGLKITEVTKAGS